jgi:hypothetical protein
MKPHCLFFALFMNLGCALMAHAEYCTVDGHKADLESAYEKVVRQNLASLPKKAGFTMNAETLEVNISSGLDFMMDQKVGQPMLQISGSFQSTTGTEFTFTVQSVDFYTSDETTQYHNMPSQ